MQPVHKFSQSSVTAADKVRPLSLPLTSAIAPAVAPLPIRSASHDRQQTITFGEPLGHRPIGEQLFVALAEAKIWTSRVAMHLDCGTRDRLFRQLDVLHDADEWVEGDRPINLEGYKSLVRAILYHEVNSRPALSLMPSGNPLALWTDGDDKLTVEFVPANRTRWLVQNSTPTGPERATGTSPLERLREVLQPYGAERWFDGS